MKLAELIEDYLEYLRYEQQGSPNTATVRYSELHQFRRFLEAHYALDEPRLIKIFHLRAYLAHLRTEAGYQPISLSNMITTLRALYNYATDRGIVPENIAQRIKKPRVESKEIAHFTWEEVEKLFMAVPPGPAYLRDLCILLVFYYSGLRLEELQNLRHSDFNADLSEVYVAQGKGDRARLLPVHPFLQRVLRVYLESKAGTLTPPAPPAPSAAFVFAGRGEGPLSKDRIYRIVRRSGELAGLDKRVSPHTFRHTFATHLHQKGVDIYRLARLLGHANIEKTAVYTHTEDEELVGAVLKLKERRAVYRRTGRSGRKK